MDHLRLVARPKAYLFLCAGWHATPLAHGALSVTEMAFWTGGHWILWVLIHHHGWHQMLSGNMGELGGWHLNGYSRNQHQGATNKNWIGDAEPTLGDVYGGDIRNQPQLHFRGWLKIIQPKSGWLVVWNMNFIFPFSWDFHDPSWLSYFSEG